MWFIKVTQRFNRATQFVNAAHIRRIWFNTDGVTNIEFTDSFTMEVVEDALTIFKQIGEKPQ